LIPRLLPFAAYLGFLGIELSPWGSDGSGHAYVWLYPVKIAVVSTLLAWFWPRYVELRGKFARNANEAGVIVLVGLLTYLAWVHMDWPWALQGDGKGAGYDPFRAGEHLGVVLAGIRLFGAAVVVPIMEELFWRSFLIRYLISSKFESVPVGTVSPLSFVATVVLFGLEHDLWLAGMLAGAAYTGLLVYTKRLWPCIFAHALTNLALGIHVLMTQEWKWW
jgi:CAAX prenyl protease-like protein